MIAELGVFGIAIISFTIGVAAGWVFAMGSVALAVRVLFYMLSDRRE